jgi:hypothetical protein
VIFGIAVAMMVLSITRQFKFCDRKENDTNSGIQTAK